MDPNPLEFLIEELSTDEIYVKVNAIHRLQIIATILGPEQTKTKLLPYLATLTYLEDEVLFALAQELGQFHPFVPGEASSLLPLLENLAALDETLIREQAVKSLIIISDILSDREIIDIFSPTILRLASAENFSARISACPLFSHVYPRSGDLKENIRQMLLELSHEDIPMVRRAALIEIGQIAKTIEKDYLVTEIIPAVRKRAKDDQDQIRALCVETLKEIVQLLSEEENKFNSLPIILLIGEDKSWKVRFSLAKDFPALAETLGKDITENSLIQTLVHLLQDIESEVRAIALLALKNTLHVISAEKIQNLIFPILESTSKDNFLTPKVRKNCAEVISEVASYAEKDFSYAKIAPLSFDLVNDENYEIKLNMIEGLGNVAKAIGPKFLTPPLCESLLKLAKESPQWRLRESVYKCCVPIARHLGSEVFIGLIQPIFFNFLTDAVNEVRKTGLKKVEELVEILPPSWIMAEFLPKLLELYHHNLGYISRRTVLHILGHLPIDPEHLIPIFTEASQDRVPNIRLVLCKSLKKLRSKMDISPFISILQELSGDSDNDVKYFALQALN